MSSIIVLRSLGGVVGRRRVFWVGEYEIYCYMAEGMEPIVRSGASECSFASGVDSGVFYDNGNEEGYAYPKRREAEEWAAYALF